MNYILNIKEKLHIENILIVMMLVLTTISGLIARLTASEILLYLFIQFFVIYLCGKTIIELVRFSFADETSKIFSSYATGYVTLLLLYLVLLLFDHQGFIVYFAGALAILNVIYRLSKYLKGQNSEYTKTDKGKFISACVMFLLAWIVMLFCFQASKLSPEITGYLTMHSDDQFWLREAVEGTRGLPMPDFSAYGVYRYYHWFSGAWCSCLHYITGIEIFDICFSLSWVGDLFLFVGGIYVLFRESKYITTIGLIGAYIALLFTSTTQFSTHIFYVHHLYVSHFGFLPGAALGTFAYALFIKWDENEKRNIMQLLLCVSTFFAALGMKSPCACIVLAGIGMICLLKMFSKERNDKLYAIIAGLIFLTVFLLTYKFLFTYPHDPSIYSVGGKLDRFSTTTSLYRSGYFKSLRVCLTGIFEQKPLAYFFSYILYWLMSNFVLFLFLMFSIIISIKYHVVFKRNDIATLTMVIAGYAVYTLMYQVGYSQAYFMLAIFPYGMYLALNLLSRGLYCNSEHTKSKRFVTAILSVILVLGVYKTCQFYYPNCFLKGYKNIFAKYNPAKVYEGSDGLSVNKDELEGLRWLRANTDKDVIIITNLAMINDRGFATCSYSERQAYIEGEAYGAASQEFQDYRYSLVGKYYSGDKNVVKTLKDEGVSYAVLFASVPEYQKYSGTVVFENGAIKIIKI